MSKNNYNLIVIGGGPAGMAVACSAARAGLDKILLLERHGKLGGILNQCIHEGFGLHYFKAELAGTEYATRYRAMLATTGVEVRLNSFVRKITNDKTVTYLSPEGEFTVSGRHLVLSTGCRERTREMLTVPGPRPSGIFTAGLAQEMVNLHGLLPGKEVVIVGSGDIGLIMARRMTLEGARVRAVLEIRPELSGLVRNKVQCLDDFNIPLLLQHELVEVQGRHRVSGIRYRDNVNRKMHTMSCDTLLFSVGLIPERDLIVENAIELDDSIDILGNSDFVHELVDHATQEAEERGKVLAEWLGGGH